ncbi:MAG: amidohydrolase family protein [Proteobacteria bacterium]|nr:amidohydrolase family protein [Pseudomonadota bacterium]
MANPTPPDRPSLVLRGGSVLRTDTARIETCDIAIGPAGRIVQIGPAIAPQAGVACADLRGRLVVPGLVDMHQHLDKTRTRGLIASSDASLTGAIAAYDRFSGSDSRGDLLARAEATANACLARGTTAIRTHVNVGRNSGLRGLQALFELRERLADRLTLQIVPMMPAEAPGLDPSTASWINDAIALGADAVGGAPAHAENPDEFLKFLFDLAERFAVPVDLHLDEHLDGARHRFREAIALTRQRGMQGRVVAGHCSALAALAQSDVQSVAQALADAGIGVVTLPAANLYLLGRDASRLTPRGLTRVKELMTAGVAVAAASDNIQDPFVPTGSGDLLEIARWTMLAAHLGAGDFGRTFDMISSVPAKLMGLEHYGLQVGARADLLIAEADDVADLISSGPLDRVVLVGGKIVAGLLPLARAAAR